MSPRLAAGKPRKDLTPVERALIPDALLDEVDELEGTIESLTPFALRGGEDDESELAPAKPKSLTDEIGDNLKDAGKLLGEMDEHLATFKKLADEAIAEKPGSAAVSVKEWARKQAEDLLCPDEMKK